MGRPSKTVHDRRTERATIRFTASELAYVETQANTAALPVAEYLRKRGLGKQVTPPKSKLEASCLTELNRIGVNLNQIAHAANAGRLTEQILQAALADLGKLMQKVDASL